MASTTTNVITQSTFVWSLLGSTVIATIVGFALGWVKEFFQSRASRNNQREEKLYCILRLNLMLMENNQKMRKEIISSKQSADKSEGYIDRNGERSEKFNNDNKKLIDHWWELARRVLKAIEENPQYIKEEDWLIIEKLFNSYLFRKFISGEETPANNFWKYDDDLIERDTRNEFVNTMNELYTNITAKSTVSSSEVVKL